jgi:hypothetical protein
MHCRSVGCYGGFGRTRIQTTEATRGPEHWMRWISGTGMNVSVAAREREGYGLKSMPRLFADPAAKPIGHSATRLK